MFGWLVWYFYTGRGGPSELACYLVPIALTLQILFRYREGKLYEWLPTAANHAIVVLYIGICIYAFAYFWSSTSRSPSTGRGPTRRMTSSSGCWSSCW
jgi:hypothetical protein